MDTFISISALKSNPMAAFLTAKDQSQPVCVMRNNTPVGLVISVEEYNRLKKAGNTRPDQSN